MGLIVAPLSQNFSLYSKNIRVPISVSYVFGADEKNLNLKCNLHLVRIKRGVAFEKVIKI